MKASERYRRYQERDEAEELQRSALYVVAPGVYLAVVLLYAFFVGDLQLTGLSLGFGFALLITLILSATRATSGVRRSSRRRSARSRR